jgi:glutamate-1-semialdehyde 2,1-aminomutase
MNTQKGAALWKRAKEIIPGGSQLLSKRSELFLPDLWPSYFQRAKGVDVWDLDDNHLVDMSIMGVGACVLGYSDEEVNQAVKACIDNGSMCTLNCPEEVELAELLISLHPWAGMVRYAKSGGEAMSVAVRIGRAHTQRDKVAFCGYHGWSDWYLAANLADDSHLDGHLMPGLAPRGVPRGLTGTAMPFNYNRIDELEAIIKANPGIGVIVVEPIRYQKPEGGFLEKVVGLAQDIGAVLIFDEITTGWRLRSGGAYVDYDVEPDIVVYGKALANGFPHAAIIGKREVMDSAQASFISSTMWTERTGLAAALATIRKFQHENVAARLAAVGQYVKAGWKRLADKHGLKVDVMGIDPLATFHFEHGEESQAMHTLFTQEMLKQGYLASKHVYACLKHDDQVLDSYMSNVDKVFGLIAQAVDNGGAAQSLEGPIAHTKFKRLN